METIKIQFHEIEIQTDTLTTEQLHDISNLISRSNLVLAMGISNIADSAVDIHPLKKTIEPWDGEFDKAFDELKEALPRETRIPHFDAGFVGPKTGQILEYLKREGEITKEINLNAPGGLMAEYLNPQERERLEKHRQKIENRHAEPNNFPVKKEKDCPNGEVL